MEVVASFQTAEGLMEGIDACQADVILVDLGLPGMSGLGLIKALRAADNNPNILVYTGSADREQVLSALIAGADGYIIKGGLMEELVAAITVVSEGGTRMSPKIANLLIKEFRKKSISSSEHLSKRENEIMAYLSEGYTYREIAKHLNISPHTVRTHIKNIYEKLGASSRIEAIKMMETE